MVVRILNVMAVVGLLISGASAAPAVTSVLNAASNKDPRLGGSSIAKGSIFIVKGTGLGPATLTIAPRAFQSTNLDGTSVRITVNGQSVDALMYYTSDTQIAALLPSNTPVAGPDSGNPNIQATITVTYNGTSSDPTPIRGVANNSLGIFTVDSSGSGPAIVTYPDYSLVSPFKAANCGGPNTTCGAVNPGDTLILWATGFGPIAGSDASGAGLGVNNPGPPYALWLGGVQATIVYQGRSGCCIGEDQIVFTVPNNVPTGCVVPLVVQLLNQVSNSTVIPVANGSRSCTPTDPIVADERVQRLGTLSSFNLGVVELDHLLDAAQTAYADTGVFTFAKASGIPAGLQPFFASYFDVPATGTCIVLGTNSPVDHLFNSFTLAPIEAGSRFTVTGPKGTTTVTANPGAQVSFSTPGFIGSGGDFTVTGGPGSDVGAFTARLTIPHAPELTSPDSANGLTVTRSQGMTVTWTAGANITSPLSGPLPIVLSTNTNPGGFLATLVCTADAAKGTFTIPPYALLGLPPTGGGAFLGFRPHDLMPSGIALFSANGLDLGIVESFADDFALSNFSLR
ncbi:MAG: hypothetical protein LAP38_02365 [Acidobacteriia bacterium]|nr:hypothetical protein [Terriglobia bacterium]